MESDVTQTALFYKIWAWGETHKKQLLYAAIALVVVGMAIAFWVVHQGQEQVDANDALSKLIIRTTAATPEASPERLLKIASDYPDTDAGQRALLLGASALFTDQKYDEARVQFQRFLQEHSDSPFAGEAALGVASCLEAQGKIDEAMTAYRNAAERYQSANVVPLAKLALARLLETQGKFLDARNQLEEVARAFPPPFNQEAAGRYQQLVTAHPELMPTNQMASANQLSPALRSALLSNRPAPATTSSLSTNKPK